MSEPSASARQNRGLRLMLGISALVYLAWWFAVEQLLPGSFNPLPGRLAVVAYFAVAFVVTYLSRAAERHAGTLFYIGALALVGHYFYLFHHNAQDINWVVGTYVVVFALCVGVQSRDYGIGIDKPLQDKVFQRFERGASARHYGGLGLGLYIVKQIVEAHQGSVRVESELGKGAAFWVDLPAHSPSVGSA